MAAAWAPGKAALAAKAVPAALVARAAKAVSAALAVLMVPAAVAVPVALAAKAVPAARAVPAALVAPVARAVGRAALAELGARAVGEPARDSFLPAVQPWRRGRATT